MNPVKKIYATFLTFLVALLCFGAQTYASNQEVVFLQTDRSVYVTGESVYYKMSVLDPSTKKNSDVSKIGYIELRAAKSNAALRIRVKVEGGKAFGSLELPDTLNSGVYQIVAFTRLMKGSGEETYFYKELLVANRFDKSLDFKSARSTVKNSGSPTDSTSWIKTDKNQYGQREKVHVQLQGLKVKANVVVSVFEEPQTALIEKTLPETMTDWTLTATKMKKPYLPETRGKIIQGRVIDVVSQSSVAGTTVLLSCPDSIPNLQYAETGPDGTFKMLLGDYYDGKELFFTLKDKPMGKNWKISMDDQLALTKKWEPELISDQGLSKPFLEKSKNMAYINQSYNLNDGYPIKKTVGKPLLCPYLYTNRIKAVYPSDFLPLNDFSEIAREILPTVVVKRRDDQYHIKTITNLSDPDESHEPTVFLDGVYVDNLNKIMALGSDNIFKIEVIQNERAYGDLQFYGIVSVISKNSLIVKSKPEPHSLRIKYDDFTIGKNWQAADPINLKDARTPFFKPILYWNPNLNLNVDEPVDFEFYTSDNLSNYLIKVEGLAEDGTPVSSCTRFQVINPNNTINP